MAVHSEEWKNKKTIPRLEAANLEAARSNGPLWSIYL